MGKGQRWKSVRISCIFARSLLLINPEIQMPVFFLFFYQMPTTHSFHHFHFAKPSPQLIKLSLCASRLATSLLLLLMLSLHQLLSVS